METLELYKQIVAKQKELIEHLKRDFYMPDEIYNAELTDIESDLSALNQQLSARKPEEKKKPENALREECKQIELYIENNESYKACIMSGHFAERFDEYLKSKEQKTH